jgi:ectoine hydroxylase-related dioxygenase (phytanoyl-CoA dioxygenase family)
VKKVEQVDIDHWHQHGYAIIEGFMTSDEVEAARHELLRYLPSWDEYVERRPLFAGLDGTSSRATPGWVRYEFPYLGDTLNRVAVHPYLVAFVERLVGHDQIALSHGAIVGKYAGKGDYDQELHPDYTNNTLVLPQDGTAQCDIPMIVFHTDVTIDLGPTYVVSKEHTRHLVADGRRFHSRAEFPALYSAEQPATMPAGSVLIYDMRTFHRGSAMRATEGARFSQFVGFHTLGPGWLGSTSFQGAGGTPAMNHFLTHASPRERQLVGFPAPADPYWNPETRMGVAARYPGMDMSPYGGRGPAAFGQSTSVFLQEPGMVGRAEQGRDH